jgi:hypothetical protein
MLELNVDHDETDPNGARVSYRKTPPKGLREGTK